MTLKQLEAFYWAATCASFAMAAERVHLTVSSLSKRLMELELSMGQPLFDRTGHRAALTEAGQRLLPLAVELLQRAEAAKAAVGTVGGLQGQCRIGSGELASLTWLPAWVRAIRAAHPALEVSLVVDIGAGLAARLDRGEIDAAVIAGRPSLPSLRYHRVGQASFVWCAAPSLAARVRQLDAPAWARQTLIALPRGSGVTPIIDAWMEQAGARPLRTLASNQWGAVAGLLAAGEGIGMLPVGLAAGLHKRGALRRLRCAVPLQPLEYGLCLRQDDPRALAAELRKSCAAVADFDAAGPFF